MISRVQVISYIISLNMVKCFYYFDNQMQDHMPSSTYHPTLRCVGLFSYSKNPNMDVTIMEEMLLH